MQRIDTRGTVSSSILNWAGDIAIVLNKPTSEATTAASDALLKWANGYEGLLQRVCSVHVVYPEHGEKQPLKELRLGWERVKKELRATKVSRVLLLGDTKMLRVAVPELAKSGDIYDCHGTLFQREEWQLVPTFPFENTWLKHQEHWIARDIKRLLKLERPASPLRYGNWIGWADCPETIVIDLETNYPVNDTITSMGVQWGDDNRAITREPTVITQWIRYLAVLPVKNYIFHNAQFDLAFMGEEFRAKTYGRIRDTMIRAKARGNLVNSLKHLGNLYTVRPGNYAWLDKAHDFDDPAYVCEDLDVTWRLFRLWKDDGSKPVVELMERATVMCVEQTIKGSKLDTASLETVIEEAAVKATQQRQELITKYGVDPSQVEVFANRLKELGYPLAKQTKSGRDALDAKVLEDLGLMDVLEWRKLDKVGTTVKKMANFLRADGTIPHIQTIFGADTGRTSMKDYNHQQSSRKGPEKKLLVSRFEGGKIGSVDLAQAEVRVAAYIAKDCKLASRIRGGDMHRVNASKAFACPPEKVTDEQRQDSKTVTFRTIYAGQPVTEGQKRVAEYLRSEFKALFKWIDAQGQLAMRDNAVTDPWGKTRNLLELLDYRGRGGVRRAGINSPIQGLASHCAIWITCRAWELFRYHQLRSLVIFGVHDSIVIDAHPDEVDMCTMLIRQAFRDLYDLGPLSSLPLSDILPLEGELQWGQNWADTKNGGKILCTTLAT